MTMRSFIYWRLVRDVKLLCRDIIASFTCSMLVVSKAVVSDGASQFYAICPEDGRKFVKTGGPNELTL